MLNEDGMVYDDGVTTRLGENHYLMTTTTGMATDQGKLSNMHALGIIAETAGVKMGELGTTTFRPPYTPLTFGAIVGRNVGEFFDITRRTPIHDWHFENKAEFENVGQWKRAWYYPIENENMHEAVQRESKAARDSAGISVSYTHLTLPTIYSV